MHGPCGKNRKRQLNVISNLLEKCDTLIIGGGMAFTFLKAQGKEIGNSLVDDTKLDYCKEGFGHGNGALCQNRILKYAHGSVPQHGPGRLHGICVQLCWKMNMTPSEAVKLIETLKPLVKNEEVDVVFCVPAIDIIPAVEAAKGTNICIGAENMYFEEKGAYTGHSGMRS